MKDFFLYCTIMTFIMINQVYGQNPRITWETENWDKGISEVTSYQAKGKTFVVLSNPGAGRAWIINVNPNGEMGNITWHVDSWPRGITALATFENNGRNFLALSCSENGNFWIFELTDDGKLLDNPVSHVDVWPQGITEMSTFDINGQDFLFLLKPVSGEAWIFRLEADGKLGAFVWNTNNWEKGINASATYESNNRDFLFLSNGSNGHAWIIELTAEGKPGKFEWAEQNWHQGIDAVTAFETDSQNYIILSAANYGKAWTFILENGGVSPKAIWSTDSWVKGISTLTSYSEDGIAYTALSCPAEGRAWIITKFQLITADLNSINSSTVTNTEIKTLCDRMDVVYAKLVTTENNLQNLNNKIASSKYSVNNSKLIGSRLGTVTDRIGYMNGVLETFSRLPMLGTAVTAITTTVNQINDKVGGLSNGLAAINTPLVEPTLNNISGAQSASNSIESLLMAVSEKLKIYKRNIVEKSPELNAEEVKIVVPSVLMNLDKIESELELIEREIGNLSGKADKLNKIEKPVSKVLSGIDDIDDKLVKAEHAAGEVDKILNKAFKKQIGPLKIDISLKKVLEGGQVGDAFKKFIDPWVKDGIAEITNKLKIPMPKIPAIDEFKNELANMKNATVELLDNSNKMKEYYNNIQSACNGISSDFNKIGIIPVN